MRERFRDLDQVARVVENHFQKTSSFLKVYILPQRDVMFRAYIFFKSDNDVLACKMNGITSEIVDAVYRELDHAGRGSRDAVTVAFEFDSDENVLRNYEGNYFLRLR